MVDKKTIESIIFDLKTLEYLQNKSDILYVNEIRASREDLARLRHDIITKQLSWYYKEWQDGYNIITFD